MRYMLTSCLPEADMVAIATATRADKNGLYDIGLSKAKMQGKDDVCTTLEQAKSAALGASFKRHAVS
jgi:hypothetical protein